MESKNATLIVLTPSQLKLDTNIIFWMSASTSTLQAFLEASYISKQAENAVLTKKFAQCKDDFICCPQIDAKVYLKINFIPIVFC